MDRTPPNTPRRNQALARQAERDDRTLDSPQRHWTPHHIRLERNANIVPPPPPIFYDPLHIPPAAAGPFQHDDPFIINHPPLPPVYQHLPQDLAQRYAALPPLRPTRGRGRGRGQHPVPPNAIELPQANVIHAAPNVPIPPAVCVSIITYFIRLTKIRY